jgi:hypothetical protein
MIICDENLVKFSGSKLTLDTEITLLLNHYKKQLAKTMGEENACNEIREITRVALLNDKELDKQIHEDIDKLLRQIFGE